MKYNVSYAYTIVGTVTVEAASPEKAEQIVMDYPIERCPGEYLEDSFHITGAEPHQPTQSEDGWLEQAYEDRFGECDA
jgi:hypothetical protein